MNPVEEFFKLTKTAGWGRNVIDAFKRGVAGGREGVPLSQGLGEVAGGLLPATLIGAGVTAGGLALKKGVDVVRERFSKAQDYRNMLDAHPSLGQYDSGEVQALYNSLRSMSPTMAKDPLIAGSFVRESLSKRPEEGPAVSPLTAKLLAETERSLSSSHGHGILDALRIGTMVPVHHHVLQQQRVDLDELRHHRQEDIERGRQIFQGQQERARQEFQREMEAERQQFQRDMATPGRKRP